MVMERGLAGTSINMILEATGITKGAFFYHFRSKTALAQALARRWAELDDDYFSQRMREAEKNTSDPLDRVMHYLDGLGEAFAGQASLPGSLFASYCYGAHEPEVVEYMDEQMKRWRTYYFKLLERVAKNHPPAVEIDLEELADYFLATLQGGFVMSRVYRDPRVVATNLRHFRRYVEFVFGRGQ